MDILVLPGDGIGPEITDATLAVLDAASRAFKLNLVFERHDIGFASLKSLGTTMPDAVLQRVPQVGGTILGPVSHYEYPPAAQGGLNPPACCARRSTFMPTSGPAAASQACPSSKSRWIW